MPELVPNSLVVLAVVVDPLGLAPIFAALTRGNTEKQRRETALGAAILLLFALAGDVLLGAFGIGLSGSRAAYCSSSRRWT